MRGVLDLISPLTSSVFGTNAFSSIDGGQKATQALLLGILVELKLLNIYQSQRDPGLVMDTPESLRLDIMNDLSAFS